MARRPFYWKQRQGWYIRVLGDDGKVQSIRLADNRTDADTEWARLQREAAQAESIEAVPVLQVIEHFIDACDEEVRLGRIERCTVDRRLAYLASFCDIIGPELAVHDLKPLHVSSWLKGQAKWGATTQHYAVESLKQAITWAVDEGKVARNPIAKVKRKKGPPRDFLVSKELYEHLVGTILAYQFCRRGVRAFSQILIALRQSGCRPGEVAAVRIEQWSGDDTWTMAKHKTSKKKPRPRVVYLSPCLQTLTRIAAQGRTEGPLFRTEPDRGWKYSDMRQRFERLRKKAKADPRCVMYSFRHTWITDALVAGADVATVAELAGTSIQMIERHYGHLGQRAEHLRSIAAKIAAVRA